MKVNPEDVVKAGSTWASLTEKRAEEYESYLKEDTADTRARFNRAAELASAAETAWRITLEQRRIELAEKAITDNERIAVALESIVSIMLERTKP